MTAIIATDLDGTVMFAISQPPAGVVTVDTIGDAYMTGTAARTWSRLTAAASLVPVTTRSITQYGRLMLPGPPARYALVCNGGLLLVNGAPEHAWEQAVRRDLSGAAAGFRTVWKQATRWYAARGFNLVHAVDEFFIYLTAVQREHWLLEFAKEAQAWTAPRGWQASLQGRKLYLVPQTLDKAVGVARLASWIGAGEVYAGGDSLLDARMLREATAAIRPNHGELHRMSFVAERCEVTVEDGLGAGEEILAWYARRAGLEQLVGDTGERRLPDLTIERRQASESGNHHQES
ncbi:MAG: hypothetical protein JXA67_18245 [Micromonosporaceae bacterium]|nr:hypothetical protein [Micromonosporaceae bacterium]